MLEIIAAIVMLSWPLSEVVIAITRRAKAGSDRTVRGGGAALVWMVVLPSIFGATVAYLLEILPFPWSKGWLVLLAAAIVFAGAALRLSAILTLGALFTVDVTVRRGHELIRRGPYRLVRHPAYTGLLLSFLGVGLLTGSWLGLALATIPPTAILIHRINLEEAVLAEQFGEPYRRYCERTKRLLPGLY